MCFDRRRIAEKIRETLKTDDWTPDLDEILSNWPTVRLAVGDATIKIDTEKAEVLIGLNFPPIAPSEFSKRLAETSELRWQCDKLDRELKHSLDRFGKKQPQQD